ncbi:MAG: hypothetical protein LBJ77_03520 [Holosporales bacterium]|jgi:hypothetical protein|nr:hypothetical protein [Holosporales bacterium]
MRIKVVKAVLAMIMASGAIHAAQQAPFNLKYDGLGDTPTQYKEVTANVDMVSMSMIQAHSGPNMPGCRAEIERQVQQGKLGKVRDSLHRELLFTAYDLRSEVQLELRANGVLNRLPTSLVTDSPIVQAASDPRIKADLTEKLLDIEEKHIQWLLAALRGPYIRLFLGEGEAVYTTPANISKVAEMYVNFIQAVSGLAV